MLRLWQPTAREQRLRDVTREADKLLNDAQVDRGTIAVISPPTRPGSSVDLIFKTPEDLQIAKAKFQRLNRVITGTRAVWLDARRTRSETRPARIVNRLAEWAIDMENR